MFLTVCIRLRYRASTAMVVMQMLLPSMLMVASSSSLLSMPTLLRLRCSQSLLRQDSLMLV